MIDDIVRIDKYVYAINEIITEYTKCHTFIVKLDAFKPEGIVSQVKPSVLSALMTFGVIQNKSLDDINFLLNDITYKLIPHIETKYPDYNLTELLLVIEKLIGFKKMLKIACENQKPLSFFDSDKLTESDILNIFSDMAIIIKMSQESSFRLMAIDVDYIDFFKRQKIFFINNFTINKIIKSYNLIFRMCSFMEWVPTLTFITIIGGLSRGRNDYKKYNDGTVVIPQYKKIV